MRAFPVVLVVALLPLQAGQAQETGTIVGAVVTQTGAALSGATITLPGSAVGATSGPDGRYTITNVPSGTHQVRARLIGYATAVDTGVVVTAGETATADFRLQVRAIELEAVVAIGYATVQKRDLTGAVASVSGDAVTLKAAPTATINTALQGRAAGVQVVTNSGMPGVGASVRIRGTNSITANSEPLYVVDGIPAEQGVGGTSGAAQDPKNNPLMSIDPNEIESIDVLKDASATGIYGARGANGVVLITTKRGRSGESHFTVESSYGFQRISRFMPVLTGPQYMVLRNEAVFNATKDATHLPYSPAQIASAPTYNYPAMMLRSCGGWACVAAPQASEAVTLSGGSERMRFLFSGNYMKQDGIQIGSDFERYGVRFNLDAEVSPRYRMGTSLSLTTVNRNAPRVENGSVGAGANGILAAMQFDPSLPPRDANGNWTLSAILGEQVENPVANASELLDRSTTSRVVGSVFGELAIGEALKVRSTLGGTFSFDGAQYYAPRTVAPGRNAGGDSYIAATPLPSHQLINENTVTYRRALGPGRIDVLGGFSVQTAHSEVDTARAQGCPSDATTYYAYGSCRTLRPPNSGASEWALVSYLGRVNYELSEKYLFTLTGRTDGSSRFGENNKWAFFPSAAVAWRVSDEPFLRKQSFFDDLKLRLSYGKTGNQAINPYQSLDQLGVCWYSTGGVEINALCPSGTEGNPDLKWETQKQFNVGIDAGVLRSRIAFSFDAYHSVTNDLLLSVPLPATSGFTSQLRNVGSVQNNGLELSVTTVNVQGVRVGWRSTLSLAHNRSKVLDLGTATQIIPTVRGGGFVEGQATSIVKVGEPLGAIYAFKTTGLWQQGDECYLQNPADCTPGEYKIVDVNGDGKIDLNDRTIVGYADPKLYGGLSNSLSYGPLTLDVFMNFSYGNQVVDMSRVFNGLSTGFMNERADVLNRWTPENTNTDIPRANFARPRRIYSALVEDGSFLRLQTLTLGYQLPSRLLWGAKAGRVYVTGQNLWIATKYSGFDPEVNSMGGDARQRGIDDGAYPRARVWNVGVNLTF
jgi:TonB-linked SusC/RagA family outer membrane protein